MVKLFEEEIHIMQLFYANQSIRNVRDISNATRDRPIPSIGTIFNIPIISPCRQQYPGFPPNSKNLVPVFLNLFWGLLLPPDYR
jgi:hypothetical protein